MVMTHPGLPLAWGLWVIATMVLAGAWVLFSAPPASPSGQVTSLVRLPVIGAVVQRLVSNRWVLLALKLLMVGFFITIIIAGLFGTQVPERNFATVLTWNLWWAGLVFSVFLLGSAWCAVCPWDALAQWLVRRRLWKRAEPNNSLNLRVPRYLQNVWPALLLFIGLTWLELGVGITTNPYATAAVSLFMVVIATVSLAIFQRKAFCRNFCPVGRTIGFYSQLAAVELRPIEPSICADCKTLDCYHGNDEVDPCPTWLVMGRLKQNSYCTSCGNCTQSCPHQNIAWRVRSPSIEAIQGARPRWDEAWFMIGLLGLTGFHGLTMMPFWESWMTELARMIGDSGQLLGAFSIGLIVAMLAVGGLYTLLVMATRALTHTSLAFKRSFSTLAFVALPLAFSYHMAHNLNHLIREGAGMWSVVMNPLGIGTLPLTMMEKHQRHLSMWMSQDMLFALQTGIMIFGFMIAVKTIRHRGKHLLSNNTGTFWGLRLFPILLFAIIMTSFHLWMLMQPMTMRM